MQKSRKNLKRVAKKQAAAKRQGVRYKKAATKSAMQSVKQSAKASVPSKNRRMKQVRAATKAQTAKNLEKAGDEALSTGRKAPSKRSLKVTPKSAHKRMMEQDKYYTGSRNYRKVAKGS